MDAGSRNVAKHLQRPFRTQTIRIDPFPGLKSGAVIPDAFSIQSVTRDVVKTVKLRTERFHRNFRIGKIRTMKIPLSLGYHFAVGSCSTIPWRNRTLRIEP
ncbi:MAG: hypothetical protein ACI8UO_004044 [Verrucomicrobiales bacterium]|jgi:hypothetical protein